MDSLLQGDTLPALMIALGRLNALTDVASGDGASWAVAQLHELVSCDSAGLIAPRARANQAQDQRDLLRIQGYVRGGQQRGGAS